MEDGRRPVNLHPSTFSGYLSSSGENEEGITLKLYSSSLHDKDVIFHDATENKYYYLGTPYCQRLNLVPMDGPPPANAKIVRIELAFFWEGTGPLDPMVGIIELVNRVGFYRLNSKTREKFPDGDDFYYRWVYVTQTDIDHHHLIPVDMTDMYDTIVSMTCMTLLRTTPHTDLWENLPSGLTIDEIEFMTQEDVEDHPSSVVYKPLYGLYHDMYYDDYYESKDGELVRLDEWEVYKKYCAFYPIVQGANGCRAVEQWLAPFREASVRDPFQDIMHNIRECMGDDAIVPNFQWVMQHDEHTRFFWLGIPRCPNGLHISQRKKQAKYLSALEVVE